MPIKNPNLNPFGQWTPSIAKTLQNGDGPTPPMFAGLHVHADTPEPPVKQSIKAAVETITNAVGAAATAILESMAEQIAQRAAQLVIERLSHPDDNEIVPEAEPPLAKTTANLIVEQQERAARQHERVYAAILTNIPELAPERSHALPGTHLYSTEADELRESFRLSGTLPIQRASGDTAVKVNFNDGRCVYVWSGEACNRDGRRYTDAKPDEFSLEFNTEEHGNKRLHSVKTLEDVIAAIRFLITHASFCACMRGGHGETCAEMRAAFEASRARYEPDDLAAMDAAYGKPETPGAKGCWKLTDAV